MSLQDWTCSAGGGVSRGAKRGYGDGLGGRGCEGTPHQMTGFPCSKTIKAWHELSRLAKTGEFRHTCICQHSMTSPQRGLPKQYRLWMTTGDQRHEARYR